MNPSDMIQNPLSQQYSNVIPLGQEAPSATNPQTHSASGFGGWLERNAQTIGSVAVPALADLLTGGAATPFDPLLSGLGGAGGQEVKNLTTGTKTNPLEEGAISGGLALGGGLLGKGVSKLLGKAGGLADRYGNSLLSQVGGTVDKSTARALDVPTTVKLLNSMGIKPQDFGNTSQNFMDIINPIVKQGIGNSGKVDTNGLNEMVDNLVNKDSGITGMINESGTPGFKLANTLKSDISKLQGISDSSGKSLTIPKGGVGPTNILAPNADPTAVSDYIDNLNKDIQKLVGRGRNPLQITRADTAEANVKQELVKELEDRLYEGPNGANSVLLSGQLNPEAVASVRRAGNQVLDHGNTVSIVSKDGSRTEMDRASFNKMGGGNEPTEGLVNQDVLDKLTNILPNTAFSKRFINALKNVKTVGELRSAMSPFVNASKLTAAKATEMGTSGAANRSIAKQGVEWLAGLGGVAAAPFTGGASAIIPAAELALSTDTGKTMLGRTLTGSNALGRLLGQSPDLSGSAVPVGKNMLIPAEENATSQGAKAGVGALSKNVVAKTVTQGLPRGAANILSGASQPSSSQSSGPIASTINSQVSQAQNSIDQALNQNATNSGVIPSANFSKLISAYGIDGMNAYMQYVRMTQPQLSDTQQMGLTLGQNALTQIKELAPLYEQTINNGTIGKLVNDASKLPFIGGSLSGLILQAGKNSTAAQAYDAYNSRRYDVARTLSRLSSEGGMSAGGAAGIANIEAILPTLSDSPAQASAKFASAVQTVMTSLSAVLSAPATNTPGQVTSFAGSTLPGTNIAPTAGNTATNSQGLNFNSNILNFLPPSMSSGL